MVVPGKILPNSYYRNILPKTLGFFLPVPRKRKMFAKVYARGRKLYYSLDTVLICNYSNYISNRVYV